MKNFVEKFTHPLFFSMIFVAFLLPDFAFARRPTFGARSIAYPKSEIDIIINAAVQQGDRVKGDIILIEGVSKAKTAGDVARLARNAFTQESKDIILLKGIDKAESLLDFVLFAKTSAKGEPRDYSGSGIVKDFAEGKCGASGTAIVRDPFRNKHLFSVSPRDAILLRGAEKATSYYDFLILALNTKSGKTKDELLLTASGKARNIDDICSLVQKVISGETGDRILINGLKFAKSESDFNRLYYHARGNEAKSAITSAAKEAGINIIGKKAG
ncbi:MAG: hypothetical protein HQM10_18870 [Candidatus Riflebacteria bacterium]|nr:hypothetical protein [Candidatus Riflebacteria bacterium]